MKIAKLVQEFNPQVATILLGLSMFFTGAAGLVSEYVLSTVSTYILGSSIEQFSITIAVMMGMMGLGGWVQKFISDNNLIEKFITIEILLTILGSFAPITIYAAFGYVENNFIFIYYFFVMFIGFLIGFEIPFIIRINEMYAKELKTNLSVVMAADYIGSFIGAIVWVYFLLPNFPLTKISFIITGFNFIIAFITFLYFRKHNLIKSKILIPFIITFVFVLIIFGFKNVTNWEVSLEQKLYDDPVIISKTTKYQHLTITQNKSLNEFRLYINGNVQFSSLDENRYHEQLVHPIMSISKKHSNVLVLGGGDGLAIRELKKYKDIKSITLVDLDPGMVEFAKTNPILSKLNNNSFKDSRINIFDNKAITSDNVKSIYSNVSNNQKKEFIAQVDVINIDADLFLHKFRDKFYDIVIIDFPDPNSIELVKLYSKEFYMKLKRVLKDDAMVVIQATSPYHAKEAFLCIGRTLKAAGLKSIPFHDNIPSFGDWGWYLAWNSNMTKNEIFSKINNLESFKVETSYITPDVFRRALIFGKGELITNNKDINTLMNPKLLEIYTKNSWLSY
ncbi:MAG: polyamine aminopropyltransferase [Arcobacter sp.]|nr:polyamine aminopropyltransferase [Arcobacter sp.]